MSSVDVVIRGGMLVMPTAVLRADIAVHGGIIVSIGEDISFSGREEIDATGLHIFPGVIDAHVHFNEPGRTEWEGFETGSRAFAAGGGTLFVDMPLNAHPPTIDGESFDLKVAAARTKSVTDFALWGGLVPGNVDKLEELAERGVVGFKAFMSNSGIDDFQSVDDRTLREGMKRAAALELPVAVHAESETITRKLTEQKLAAGKISVRDYLESRPIEAELDAIRRAIYIAGETQCALHIVHVSSAAGVALVTAAKRQNVDVTSETCPHYLTLTDADMETIGALAKCAPPLRSPAEQNKLWERIVAEEIDTIGSDHSPSRPEMKTESNFFKVWGGISGVQHTLPLMLTRSSRGNEALAQIARLLSFNVAKRLELPKGRIETGCDADFALVRLNEEFTVNATDLFYRHKQTAYQGRKLRGKTVRTILRGQTIFCDGKIVAKPAGRLIKPVR